jgi:hypothetical protein
MALYIITYDLRMGHKDEYPSLRNKLEELGAVRILDSVWVLNQSHERLAQQIGKDLRDGKHLKVGDGLLVQEVDQDAFCENLDDPITNEVFYSWLVRARF